MHKTLKFTILLLICSANLFAQNECGFLLQRAQKLYEDGNLQPISALLDSCLNDGFTPEEKIQAYKLLILANLYDDKPAKAETLMYDFLEYEPEYRLSATDPAEFYQLYNSFRTSPSFSIGFSFGTNYTFINPTHRYGVYNLNQSQERYIASKSGYQFGFRFNRYLVDHLECNLELIAKQQTFEYRNTMFDFSELSYIETQSRLELPVLATVNFGQSIISPLFRFGFSFNYLLDAKATATRRYVVNLRAPITGSSIPSKSNRKDLDISTIAAFGLRYKIKRGYIVFDIRYSYGLTNIVNTKTRYSNSELIYKYFYIDNDMKIRNISFSLSYERSFYKAMKKVTVF